MRRRVLAALLGLLALGTGCQDQRAMVYAPWEEGLGLIFEDPRLPADIRWDARLQVLVSRSRLGINGERAVDLLVTTQTGQHHRALVERGGGLYQETEDGHLLRILPERFPAVQRWREGDLYCRILARGAWLDTRVALPDQPDRMGIWVERLSLSDPVQRIRTLYLPDLGEVESWVWIKDAWVCTSRLAGRGWVDAGRGA